MGSASGGTAQVEMDTGEPATETVAGSPSFSEDVKGRQTCLRSSGGYPAGLHLWTVYAILAFTLAVPPKQGAAIRVSV